MQYIERSKLVLKSEHTLWLNCLKMTLTCNNLSFCIILIQGLGLYAARDIEKYTMVIEYIGTIIRNEVANRKEKMYEAQVCIIIKLNLNNQNQKSC